MWDTSADSASAHTGIERMAREATVLLEKKQAG